MLVPVTVGPAPYLPRAACAGRRHLVRRRAAEGAKRVVYPKWFTFWACVTALTFNFSHFSLRI